MRKIFLSSVALAVVAAGLAVGSLLSRGDSGMSELVDGERVVDWRVPRMVAKGVRLERVEAKPDGTFTFTYTLLNLTISELQGKDETRRLVAWIDKELKRAVTHEARRLPQPDATVTCRYLDRDGDVVAEAVIKSSSEPCEVLKTEIAEEPSL